MQQRTRIVCTIGPSSDSDEIVRAMIRAGMDVARLNFSHGDHATHTARIERIRRIAKQENAIVAILADLQGPKIRVGEIAGGQIRLEAGATFTLTNHKVMGDANRVSIDFADLPQAVQPGNRILLDDGCIELQAVATGTTDVVTKVITGGDLKPRKGVNLPGVPLKISALTEKDRNDLNFAVEHQVDYIALSFVRRAEDVIELKQLLRSKNAFIPVISKIEKPEAVEHIDSILEASDGVMVARGDLGVEVQPEQVPIFQKSIIRKANAAGKPVITATQMLESMIQNPRPTRAEASDVANAILDGTDAIMLSAETAAGKYPVQAVQMMAHIGNAVEASMQFQACQFGPMGNAKSMVDAIGNATCDIARQLNAKLIITATSSGFTARMISRHRPMVPIFAVTSSEKTLRRLALVWGVAAQQIMHATTMEQVVSEGIAAAVNQGLVREKEVVIITAGVPAGIAGRTNMIQVRVVGEKI
ncbi:MAG: pyruvate kinase [Chloroflexi bacterium]|nr:pyruvate kinase [Chloroflexota bacterium]